jgi:glycine C-acetyltransferase
MIMVDDAHATGVVGPTGRGTAEYFGLMGKIDITTVTLSKAIGTVGGAICGSRTLIKNIRHVSRAHNFSTSLPPPVCAAAIASFKIIKEEPERVERLRKNVEYLHTGLARLGYRVMPTDSAIVRVIIGNEASTYKLAYVLGEMGVFVNAVSRPAVPRELSRLRVSLHSELSKKDLDTALDIFDKAGKKLKII